MNKSYTNGSYQLNRGLKPHPLGFVCFVLGFKFPLQNVITLAQRVRTEVSPGGTLGHITNYELFNGEMVGNL